MRNFRRPAAPPSSPNSPLDGERGSRSISTSQGFTLVELLVVIAIIGTLVALLLPAVQAARESGRRATCMNHTRQLALAAIQHSDAIGVFPSGGWGASWTGDPDRGSGRSQPGGWIYSILPWLELGNSLHSFGGGAQTQAKREAARKVSETPLAVLHCPSRREAITYEHAKPYFAANSETAPRVARSDYAANSGHNSVVSVHVGDVAGPASDAEVASYPWHNADGTSGIVFLRSAVRGKSISDGLSATILLGEKYLDIDNYTLGLVFGDRAHAFVGLSPDNVRMVSRTTTPIQDGEPALRTHFGSAHPTACHFAWCDGSVRAMAFDVDPLVYEAAGTRANDDK